MSALAAARRDAVSSPAGRLAACLRSISSAAKRRPSPCFSASALRCACACASAWRTRSASALRRASSSSLRRRSASARSCAFCSSSILREKASRPARKSGAGAPGPDGLRGSLAIHYLPKADFPGEPLPGATRLTIHFRALRAQEAECHQVVLRFGLRTSSSSATPCRRFERRLNLSSQPRACVGEIGARLARSGEPEQPSVIKLRLRGVARACRREARAVQAAIAARLAQLRGLVFLQRLGRARELHQHVAEQLARGQQAPRRDDVLLALVLDIGCLAHETERLVALLLRERGPAERREPHHLDLVRPVLVLRRLELVAQRSDALGVLLGGGRIAAPRRAESAREMRHRLGERKLARARCEL